MARISYSSQALSDLEAIADFLVHGGFDPLPSLDLIDEAITILSRHPFIGRIAEYGMRELVISHGRTGYIALYSYEAAYDAVLIYAVRHQREAGYHNKP